MVTNAPTERIKHRVLPLIVALVLAAVLLYFSLRGIDWHAIARTLQDAQLGFVVLAVLLFTLSHLLRSVRWYLLLQAAESLPWSSVFWALEVGYLGNNILPARLGEVIRAALIGLRSRVHFSYAFATTLAERITDSIVLVTIGLIASVTVAEIPEWLNRATRSLGAIAILGILALFIAPRMQTLPKAIVARLPLPSSSKDRLIGLLDQFFLGVASLQQPRRALSFFAITVIVWVMDGISAVLTATALGLDLKLNQALILLAALGLASAAPSTPGYVGIYQFVALSILVPFGFLREQALAFIVIFQALIYTISLLWGGLGIARLKVSRAFFLGSAFRKDPPA